MDPGSPQAKALGCLCDQVGNNNGLGTAYATGVRHFLIAEACPQHGRLAWGKAQITYITPRPEPGVYVGGGLVAVPAYE
jgi:hypothetical protein